MDPIQRQLMAQKLMGGAAPILPQGLQSPVAQQIAPFQGMQPPAGQRDFVTGARPPFPANAATPGIDPMGAIRPPAAIDPRGESRIGGLVPDLSQMRRNI